MPEPWPEPVERVAAYLRAAGAEARLEQLPGKVATADEAARAVGCEPGQIGKSVVFDCDGVVAVVLVPGDRRADPAKVAKAVGTATARVARPEEVVAATGFEPGAVAPFPLPRVSRVLVEQLLLAGPVVWIGAGSDTHLAAVSPGELVRLSRGTPMDVVAERP
jgi:prolyl-tRNA editing enzyme YbaK/EbsC (Cys-tRNA(Pro) deacylase)